ncbi:MAG: hypothetical protein DRQ60_04045 [Gammaproteobacteria bacterium]|nr:MAG: hypothetical protein DRQ54_04805 [Gammaproteobacteria bacterium]RLA16625.1 MAG: hypothetical protein DRQ60_04045 [Gammaproteobacteria bacterium]
MVRKITAANSSMMTGPGTNTFIIGQDQITVVDPEPAISEHVEAIANHCNVKLEQTLQTHTYPDHSPRAVLLQQLTGTPIKSVCGRAGAGLR